MQLELDYWTERVLQFWKGNNIMVNPGTSLAAISKVEHFLYFNFSEDFKHLYQKVNGFKDLDWNKAMFSIWPLERIVEEYAVSGDKNFIGFCDYLINSHCIGFFKSDIGVFKEYDQTKPFALTFAESIDLINMDSKLLY